MRPHEAYYAINCLLLRPHEAFDSCAAGLRRYIIELYDESRPADVQPRWFAAVSVFMQVDVPVEVDAETAAILQHTRFSPDFIVQTTDEPDPGLGAAQQVKRTGWSVTRTFYYLGGDKVNMSLTWCSYTMCWYGNHWDQYGFIENFQE